MRKQITPLLFKLDICAKTSNRSGSKILPLLIKSLSLVEVLIFLIIKLTK